MCKKKKKKVWSNQYANSKSLMLLYEWILKYENMLYVNRTTIN